MGRRFVCWGVVVCVLCAAGVAMGDLVGHWKLDEGSGAILDSSGNGNDGTIVGNPTPIAGVVGKALEFHGLGAAGGGGDYINCGSGASLDITGQISIALWIRPGADDPEGQGTETAPMAKALSTASPSWSFQVRYGWGASQPYMAFTFNTSPRAWAFVGQNLEKDEWCHIACTHDGQTLKCYLDGVETDSTAMGAITSSPTPVLIGSDGWGCDWIGGIDDVRMYNHCLTPKELIEAMLGGGPELAANPVPEKEASDVPRDVVLGWSAGKFAATHDVYLGESFEDVNTAGRGNALGVLLSEGQTATTFDPPDLLEFGATYYWRIDEVNGAPDFTIYKGEVWSFTTEPFAYPVAGVVVTTNGAFDEGAGPAKTVDGSGLNDADQHSTESTDMWLATPVAGEALWIQYEFEKVLKLHELLVWNYNVQFEPVLGFGIKSVTIEYSVDGEEWTVLGDAEFARATARSDYVANTVVDFGGVPARFVRLNVNSGHGMMGQYGLSEVRFMHIPVYAREPQPASGATNLAPDLTLRWRAGREAAMHEVYLSTEEQAVIDRTAPVIAVSEALLEADMLDLARTYYWRVDEVNEAETPATWQGELWSFDTQEYLVVEDFESYNDVDRRIFDTWIDGWVNDTGSTVGHLETPFAERSIVRSGRQSMPFYYDNSATTYSEATVNLADLQVGPDWTLHGVEALTLYFHGDPDNSAEQMYVKLNGSKIVYDGDAGYLTQALWRPWNVNLADLNVNLRSVTELSIGFERAGAAGGKGVVYFDDLRLVPAVSPAGTFSIHSWTGDHDSGISSDKVYTHTGKFSGEGNDGEPFFAGNGVYFERDMNRSGTNWTLTGPATNVFDTTNPVNVTGDGAALARGFFYGDQDDNHPVLTLTNLAPGTTYVATFYTVGYGGAGGRFTDITPGDNPRNPTRVDQNSAGSGNGQLITYTYTATGTEMSFVFDALVTGDSWHHYAFSNEVASSNQAQD